MTRDFDMIQRVYAQFEPRLATARMVFGRPLTLAEKILAHHLAEPLAQAPERGETYVMLNPDRVAMQDATAQMALLQFMHAGRKTAAVPSTIHCDHLICAEEGAGPDLEKALAQNQEVYAFLRSVALKYHLGFWKPGAGIIHQILLENYAFPGGLMIGTDSHTPNAGGLCMAAVGVGGADAVDVMAGMPWELKWPKLMGVRLTGRLKGWASPKDVILFLLGKLTVNGGTGKIIEYFGDGLAGISCTGKATITNMGAELGATTSIFPYDATLRDFLKATGRADVAELADKNMTVLSSDPEVLKNPEKYYDEVLEIDLSSLTPHLVGPHTPDLARPIAALALEAKEKGYPEKLSASLVGSCTNASYEDIGKAAAVAAEALKHGKKALAAFFISPGSELVRATAERDGFLSTLKEFGAVVLSNSCGPCIGQWKRKNLPNEKNSIVTTFNRNFHKRNDGSANTLAFMGSPELATVLAAEGKLTFDPSQLPAPVAAALPEKGFVPDDTGLELPPENGDGIITIRVAPDSQRLQLLAPFPAWDNRDFHDLPVLLKVKGKCTTDHISPAGEWLQYRGHLDNISDNAFLGAVNAFTGETGKGTNPVLGEKEAPFPKIARDLKARGLGCVVIGDGNYGEGSSREHAAMSPRFLGVKAVIARSFARIHETNLKKQGVLPLMFEVPADYDKVRFDDRLTLRGVTKLAPGSTLTLVLDHSDGSREEAALRHTLSTQQIEWFKAGSALNLIARKKP
ncbi:MAG: aconitate hydratase [Fibrobacterota bacterium]